jgi:uncharacterized phage protein gp47/JayE
MPFSRPTLVQLISQAQQDIIAGQIIDQSTGQILQGLLAQANLLDVATMEAGLVNLLYDFVDWLSEMAVPWTAGDEFLEGWAALKAVTRKAASASTGTFVIASDATNGAELPSGAIITRSDGIEFATTASATVSGGALSAPIRATTVGSVTTLVTGTPLTIAAPVGGIPINGTATAGTAGADAELDDALRTRMLAAFAAPAQGGDRADYVEWATAVTGVTRAWVAPNGAGSGTVVLYTMWDDAEAANGGFPQGSNGVSQYDAGPGGTPRDTVATGDQLTVADAIVAQQPATALVYSCAPTKAPQNFAIGGLGANNTAAIQAAITAALQDMFLRLGNVGGTSNPATGEAWAPIDPSDWYAAISSVTGIGRFTVTEPTAPITPGTGQLPTLSVPPTFSS